MDSATMSASSQLLYLLNHQLVTDELAAFPPNVRSVLDIVDNARLIVEADKEARNDEKAQSAIHRWNLRITSLTGSKIAAAQAAGFQLAVQTAQQSEHLYLQNARAWFNAALLIVSRKSPASLDSFTAAAELLVYSFEKARYLPEFAREVANAGAVRKFGEGLLNYAGTASCDIDTRVAAVDILSDLIVLSASPLRPLSQHIQNLAVGLLCTWSSDSNLFAASRAAACLLSRVYIVAGKAQAGQSWRRTVESICGSIHVLLHSLASTTMEESGLIATLAPLDMPPIASTSESHGPNGQAEFLQVTSIRLQALVDVLVLMLATPTERAVPVPVSALVKLCQRMLNLTIYSPVKERHDTALRLAQVALLPTLHSQACRLLAQLVASIGIHLTGDATQLLTLLSFVEGSYPAGSTIRVSFFAVASLIVEHVPVHPDEAVRPITKIVQSILRDAASLVDPEEGRKTILTNDEGKSAQKSDSRKAKRARLFESDQVMSGRKRTSLAEAELISHSLSSLHRIILHGAWLFPGSLLNHTLRLLLAYGVSGQFLNAPPGYAPNALLSEGLSLCPEIRTHILNCLLASLQSIGKEAHGTLELALIVFRNSSNATLMSEDGRKICSQAIGVVNDLLRPVFPPLVKSAALRQATRDLTGGSISGKEADYADEMEVEQPGQMDLREAEAIQSASRQAASNLHDNETINVHKSRQQQGQLVGFPSSAAPSAQEATILPFGRSKLQETLASSTIVSESANIAAGHHSEAHASSLEDSHASSSRRTENPAIVEAGSAQPSEFASDEVGQGEEEPTLVAGGGRQAELAAVKWDAEDSDTSDDDAPMPKIYMTDDEEE